MLSPPDIMFSKLKPTPSIQIIKLTEEREGKTVH
jgi:hypothetical protein